MIRWIHSLRIHICIKEQWCCLINWSMNVGLLVHKVSSGRWGRKTPQERVCIAWRRYKKSLHQFRPKKKERRKPISTERERKKDKGRSKPREERSTWVKAKEETKWGYLQRIWIGLQIQFEISPNTQFQIWSGFQSELRCEELETKWVCMSSYLGWIILNFRPCILMHLSPNTKS